MGRSACLNECGFWKSGDFQRAELDVLNAAESEAQSDGVIEDDKDGETTTVIHHTFTMTWLIRRHHLHSLQEIPRAVPAGCRMFTCNQIQGQRRCRASSQSSQSARLAQANCKKKKKKKAMY